MTKRLLAILGGLLLAIQLPAQQLDATVATVKLTKTQPIAASTLRSEIATTEKIILSQGRTMTDADRTAVLNALIDLALFRQAAERDNIVVTDSQVNAQVEQRRQALSQQVGRAVTLDELKAQVVAGGQAWDAWVAGLKDSVLPQLYVSQAKPTAIKAVVPQTADDIRYYYESNPAQFVLGRMIEFEHIFVDTQGKDAAGIQAAFAKAKSLGDRIAKGERFEDVATSSSEDASTKDKGGYAGWLRPDQPQTKALGREFTLGVLSLKEGQVSGVIRSAAGYHIVKVLRIIPAKLYGLDEKAPPLYAETVSDTIARGLDASSRQQAMTAAIQVVSQDLRKAAEIKINEKSLGFTLVK